MFERFTAQARRVIQLAHRQAHRLHHDWIGTEHLLLGLLQEGSDGIARLLASFNLQPEQLAQQAETLLTPGAEPSAWEQLPLTPRLKRLLDDARVEANGLHHDWVGTEHLLLALLREPDGEVTQLLLDAGLTLAVLREQMRQLPAPEDRAAMVRPERRSGIFISLDPSARDLEGLITDEALPASGPTEPKSAEQQDAKLARSVRLDLGENKSLAKSVERQLRVTQFALGGLAGALACAVLLPYPAMWLGLLVGWVLAAVRDIFLAGVLGAIAGLAMAMRLQPGSFWVALLALLAGTCVGACLGDWRRRLPPVPSRRRK